jgi:2-amino-4-hydroxy-6-hydroxymethyldihydropteridine diphosphokinase
MTDGQTVRAFIGLGSNLGDRLATLREAVLMLADTGGVDVVRTSRVYETTAIGPAQPDYLNAVAQLWTWLSARELLDVCLGIEEKLGRVRDERWGPRTIDLDLLNYGSEVIQDPDLVVPHPRMHERAFVLVPLLELEPHPLLPEGRRIGALRLAYGSILAVRPFAPPVHLP